MKKTRLLVLFDTDGEPPASQDYRKQIESTDEAEFDIARALIAKGHQVRMFGFRDNLDQLIAGLRVEPADVIFNLAERFRGQSALDYTVTAVLEMLDLPYTGASSEGLMLARDKALTKKVFAYQGIRIPHFMVCYRGSPVQRPSDLRFPLIVKPLDEDASVGIAQASVVRDDDALKERVTFIHERIQDRRHRRGVHRRPRALHRRHGQRPAGRAAAHRDGVRQRLDRREPDRHLQGQVERSLPRRARDSERDRREPLRPSCASDWPRSRCAPTRRRDCATTAASTSAWRTTTPSTSWRPTPIPTWPKGEDLAWAAEEGGHLYPDFIEQIAEMAIKRGMPRG